MSSRQACRRRVAAPCAAQREKIAGYSGRSARTLYSRSQNSAVYFIASSCLPVGEGCAVYPLHGALGRRPLRSVKWQAWGRSSAGRASRSQCEGLGISWFLKCDGPDHRLFGAENVSEAETPAGVVRDFPLAPNRANLTLSG